MTQVQTALLGRGVASPPPGTMTTAHAAFMQMLQEALAADTFQTQVDLRSAYSFTQFMTNEEVADEVRFIALRDAFSWGRSAADDGGTMPILFADVPSLANEWLKGLEFELRRSEMANCHACRDPHIDLCPTHG